jgi:hypothetical protein
MADKGKFEYSDRISVPLFRGAFVRLFTPEDVENEDGTISKIWGVTAMYGPDVDIGPLKAAVVQAAKKLWGDKAATMIQNPKFKNPLKTGRDMADRDGNLYTGFTADMNVIKFSSKKKPGLVDRKVRAIVDEEGRTLVDEKNEVYQTFEANKVFSGCWFYATVSAQAYDTPKSFGVSFKLDNVQLVKADERLGGGGAPPAKNDFKPIEDAAGGDDLTDLLG